MQDVVALFAVVPDPRASNVRHDLVHVLVIAFAAMLCGAETCCDMALFARSKEGFLCEALGLRHGVPSHDTFSRIFRLLDPDAFEAAFRRFTAGFAARLSGRDGLDGQVIAIDGKSLAGAVEPGARTNPMHLVTAWATDQRLVLAQRRAPGRSEVKAAHELVEMLDLMGATVTADALHGSRAMAKAIHGRGGDYVLAIKGNRGPMFYAMQDLLRDIDPAQGAATSGTAHGRYEERRAVVALVPPDWADRFRFKGLVAAARIDGLRRLRGKTEQRSRYFALSRPMPPDEALRVVRAHWTIENNQHWVLDVVMDEDRARSRKDNGPENLALLRRLALNTLRSSAEEKLSIRSKIKKAGWNTDYLFNLLLSHMQ